MNRFLLSTFLLLFILTSAKPANIIDFRTVDKLTGQYFIDQKWDSVIFIGKKALRQGIDYYYLRARMGISYFSLREYFPAITHLVKAREFNSDDPGITDYLYRSYLYTNRTHEANVIRPQKLKDNKEFRNSVSNIVEQLHLEGGYTWTDDKSDLRLPHPLMNAGKSGGQEMYGVDDLYKNNLYGNLSLSLRIFKRLGLTVGYNYLDFSKILNLTEGHFEDRLIGKVDSIGGTKFIYAFPWVIHDTSFQYKVIQHEVHLGFTVSLPAGFILMPAFHYIHASYKMVHSDLKTTIVNDTSFQYSADNTIRTFAFQHYDYTFSQKDTSFNNYLVGLTLMKYFGIFNIGLEGSWSNLNNKTQKQAGFLLTYYPFGNLNFYGTSSVKGFFQEKESRLLLSQVLGARLTSWCWAEGALYWGDFSNASLLNGSLVFNNSDKMNYRATGTLTFIAGPHIQLSLIYQYFRNVSQQVYFITTTDQQSNQVSEHIQTKNNPYSINNLIGGITWKL